MDIRGQLLSTTSRKSTDLAIHIIGDNPELFGELMEVILNDKDPLPMRASWVAEGITAKYPHLIVPYTGKLVKNLRKFTHPGTLRNILKIFSRMDIKEKYHGQIVDMCFEWLAKENMPVAVKVFSMQIIANLIRYYPELRNEFFEVLDEQLPRNSAGFRARVRKIKSQVS
jgi:hypothetical protein